MRPVLLITSNNTLIPVMPELAETFDLCVIGQHGVAVDMGIEGAFPLGKYGNPDLNEVAINVSYQLAAKLLEPKTSASLSDEVERWANTPKDQLSASRVQGWWPAMVGEHVRQHAMVINMLKAAMEERRVVGCLVHEDVTPDMRATVLYCKERGVPTFHVPHANTYYTDSEWDIHTESISDYICASGNYTRDFYTRWGYLPDKIRLTGVPQLDSWYGDNPPSRNESRRVLGLDDRDFVILYATSWAQLTAIRGEYEVEHTRNLTLMADTARAMKATLVIKMHPGEAQGGEANYHKFLQETGTRGCVTRHYNEYALRAGDVLVSHGPSNICLQSAIIGLPSVYIPTEGHEFPFGVVRYNGDMIEAIRQAQGTPKEEWDRFAHTMNCAHPEGGAAKRVAEFVKETIGDLN